MTEGDSYARPFKKIGMRLLRQDTTIKEKKLLKQKIKLADYKTDTDKPVKYMDMV